MRKEGLVPVHVWGKSFLSRVVFSMDVVGTPSVGTGFCLSVGTCCASGRHADAQKRVPTEKTYP